MENENLTVLNPVELTKIFEDCENHDHRITTRLEMEKRLSEIGSTFDCDQCDEDIT